MPSKSIAITLGVTTPVLDASDQAHVDLTLTTPAEVSHDARISLCANPERLELELSIAGRPVERWWARTRHTGDAAKALQEFMSMTPMHLLTTAMDVPDAARQVSGSVRMVCCMVGPADQLA